MNSVWGRHDDAGEAVRRIIAAAELLYVDRGFEATTMADIAAEAGCSRATLYNYFANKRELRAALRNRAALDIAAEARDAVSGIGNPVDALTEAMVTAIERVRSSVVMSAWFTAENIGLTHELVNSSDVIETIAAGFTGESASSGTEMGRLRARLIVRSIVSFLSAPEPDATDERRLIREFIAPALLAANEHASSEYDKGWPLP